jgi:hypothetical protein
MMYIKHVAHGRFETMIEAVEIHAESVSEATPEVRVVRAERPNGSKYIFEYGDVFIMSETGKTLDRHYLGDFESWAKRKRPVMDELLEGNVRSPNHRERFETDDPVLADGQPA